VLVLRGVARQRPVAAAEPSACGRGYTVARSVGPRSSIKDVFVVATKNPHGSGMLTTLENVHERFFGAVLRRVLPMALCPSVRLFPLGAPNADTMGKSRRLSTNNSL